MKFALFARHRNTATTPPVKAPPHALFANLDNVDRLPHLSDTVVQAMAMTNSPDATLADMAALVRRDGVLTAAVLKQANRTGYGRGGEITDVRQAVIQLGLRGCGNILATVGVKSIYAKRPAAVQVACENVLRHSLFVAGLSDAIARSLRLALGGDEYTAGLLHDIGRVVMCVNAADQSDAICSSGSDSAPEVRASEREAFGTDHCAVGALFAAKNHLPTRIGRAIQHHHSPEDEGEFRSLTAVVALADCIANHLHKHRQLDDFPLDIEPSFEMLRRLVVSERALAFPDQLPTLVKGCIRDTRALLKTLAR